jgi:hypothetical protein
MPEPQPGAESQPRRWSLPNPLLLLLVALTLGLVGVALVRDVPPAGVLRPDNKNLFVLLAPFLAMATAIERFWEAVFGWYESFILKTATVMGTAGRKLGWAGQELLNAEQAMALAVESLAQSAMSPDYPQAYAHFRAMEQRLQEAQVRVEESLKSPKYKALKRAITLLGSFALGLGLSITSKLTLLEAAGFQLDANVDLLLTGLLVGAGAGPLHAFIGWFNELRNTLAGLADVTRGTALKKASEALLQAAPAPVPPPVQSTFRGGTSYAGPAAGEAVPLSTGDTLTHQRQVEHLLSRSRR